ncbi:UDP-glucuronosyltransferase 1-6 [Strongylocentrotus purpuratus]|uniref:Glucuronosyltransferase n=1 Tax=Strongylocentrotus purpuratus TaxID=7668 RepID=A0A7M7STU7_STRPU|nr:UDP-glucuronosyltransferase 1-6 [Strongylocentrotus purpuratus]XP_797993.4 UDP-glucuronosyltransferase 1-6 [Strongylocentrotus purpuratus]|eukprot:XP_011671826.1 PREDICTED: UDP-glucuronosyltransferase 1-6 [Strongylocentrotus purpuratus]
MMKMFGSFLAFVIVVDAISSANGANIIISLLVPGESSHAKGMSAIGGALTRRGHNVTILTSSTVGTKGFQKDDYNKAVQYKFQLPPDMPDMETLEKDFINLAFESDLKKKVKVMGMIFSVMRIGCQSLLDDSATLTLLKESTFDILIGDSFDGCDALLSSYLGIPFIAVTTGTRYPLFNEHTYGVPTPSSYVPFGFFPFSDKMSFCERVGSFLEHHLIAKLLGWSHFGALNEVKDKHGIAPGRSIPDLLGEAELWMCMTSFAFDFPRPTTPNWIELKGLTDIPVKPLPQDYADFVDGSGDHGFIVFSLGTHFSELPKPGMAEAFARVFSELPQRVIWRYTGPRPRYLGNNTMLVKWMPQNDLLGHPKARLLIYHGGLAGIYEAISHAVPMVIMPIFADQPSNAVRVEAKGMGRVIEKDSITYETVKEAVVDVLENPSYLENIRRYSGIYRDSITKPDDVVGFWVEHILKFGGSHLRSRALELSFIQLHSIDVLAFIVGIIAVIVFLLYTCCKRCLSCCLKSKKTKIE